MRVWEVATTDESDTFYMPGQRHVLTGRGGEGSKRVKKDPWFGPENLEGWGYHSRSWDRPGREVSWVHWHLPLPPPVLPPPLPLPLPLPFSCPSPPHASLSSVWLGGPYLLVPALDQADETLHLGGTLLEEGSLQLREAGGELTSSPQALALLDEPDVDLGVRSVVSGQLTCSGRIHSLQMSALL